MAGERDQKEVGVPSVFEQAIVFIGLEESRIQEHTCS